MPSFNFQWRESAGLDATSGVESVYYVLYGLASVVPPLVLVGAVRLARALAGDPLDWVAREGTPIRIDPAPSWAPWTWPTPWGRPTTPPPR